MRDFMQKERKMSDAGTTCCSN